MFLHNRLLSDLSTGQGKFIRVKIMVKLKKICLQLFDCYSFIAKIFFSGVCWQSHDRTCRIDSIRDL